MFKIGDKIKFDTYYCINFLKNRNQMMRKTLSGQNTIKYLFNKYGSYDNYRIRDISSGVIMYRRGNISSYAVAKVSDDKIHEGTYIGTVNRKMCRIYDKDKAGVSHAQLSDLFTSSPTRVSPFSRYNPCRIDNKRKLDKIILVSVGKNRVIGINNKDIIKKSYGKLFQIH